MLTKDLLNYKIRKGCIKPVFISPNSEELLSLAEQLILIFKESTGKTQTEIITETMECIEACECNLLVGRGLEKLLLDRTKFEDGNNAELVTKRQELFLLTTKLLRNPEINSGEKYFTAIEQELKQPKEEISALVYSDLPMYCRALSFNEISAENLLHRYNCAQVQGLLIHSTKITLKLPAQDVASMRQLVKYMRFHHLYALITRPQSNYFTLEFNGPLDLFYQSKKYGINLANFFPAILWQKIWNLFAEITIKDKPGLNLELDESCSIQSHYKYYNNYIPEDILIFKELFKQKNTYWDLTAADDFYSLPGDNYCFPDLIACGINGEKVFIELFHGWHSTPLLARLKQVQEFQVQNLILGVARQLLKEENIAHYIDNSAYFSKHGFLFRDSPTCEQLGKVLDNYKL